MARYLGVVFAVLIGVLTTTVLGLKFKKQEGYAYKPVIRSPVELDIQLTINDKTKVETALFLNETKNGIRPYVVNTREDTDHCLIIYHNNNAREDNRPACTDKTPVDFEQYPADVKAKCEGKKHAYELRERQCRGESDDTGRPGGKSLQKRVCYFYTETYAYYRETTVTEEVELTIDDDAAYYDDYYYYYFYPTAVFDYDLHYYFYRVFNDHIIEVYEFSAFYCY